MSLEDRESIVVNAAGVDLNQAQNVVLLTFVASKPIQLHRHSVIADAAAGLLAPTQLKLRVVPIATGVAADIADTVLTPGVQARGVGVYRTIGAPEAQPRIQAGDTVTIAVETDAGGASTADVALEFWELPANGDEWDLGFPVEVSG